jgi:DNA helicase-2/ATP-dependent DNA helicase PcrA
MQTNLEMLLKESASQAVSRIVRVMGYSDYLERAHVNDGKLRILEALAANEVSADRLLERMQELSEIIREKKSSPDCKLIFSTIHSSKGLEYDTVYLMDAIDGIFPETIVKDRNQASMEERKIYEEQRRLYYVAVTRAKNNLNIFSFKDKSTLTYELLGKEKIKHAGFGTYGTGANGYGRSRFGGTGFDKSGLRPTGSGSGFGKQTKLSQQHKSGKTVTDQAYREKLEEILTTGHVKHKTFGEGTLVSADGDTLEIRFKTKTAKCKLRFMMENGIIE